MLVAQSLILLANDNVSLIPHRNGVGETALQYGFV